MAGFLYNSVMKLVDKNITIDELRKLSVRMFGGLVKAVIDIDKKVMVVDAAMHADEELFLLNTGSRQDDLWGINLYPEIEGDDFIEFDSMINVRPRLNNFSRTIENKDLQQKIRSIVAALVSK